MSNKKTKIMGWSMGKLFPRKAKVEQAKVAPERMTEAVLLDEVVSSTSNIDSEEDMVSKADPRIEPQFLDALPSDESVCSVPSKDEGAEVKGRSKKRFSLKALFRKHSENDFSFEPENDDANVDELHIRPIRILIGYIPDVTEKDARYFAAGIAERNVESPYIGYFSLFRYGTGYAYEIQEGGTGRSLLDPVLQYYKGLPYGQCDRETAVFIRTSQRMVQIEKSSDGGLICVQLPESSTATETEWLKPTKKLKLLRDLNTGFMVASGAFLGLTFIALAAAFASRYQPYEQPPIPKQDKVNISDLPSSRWYQVESPGEGHYVRTWQFTKGKWQTPELGNFAPSAPSDAADKKASGKENGNAAPLPLPPVPLPLPGPDNSSSKGPK